MCNIERCYSTRKLSLTLIQQPDHFEIVGGMSFPNVALDGSKPVLSLIRFSIVFTSGDYATEAEIVYLKILAALILLEADSNSSINPTKLGEILRNNNSTEGIHYQVDQLEVPIA